MLPYVNKKKKWKWVFLNLLTIFNLRINKFYLIINY
jgi:hypothetical protein